MAQIKLKGIFHSFYRIRNVIAISFLIAFFINNKIGALYIPGDAIISANISSYYLESSMLTFYATPPMKNLYLTIFYASMIY